MADGLYIARLERAHIDVINQYTTTQLTSGNPAIFLCPERIKHRAETVAPSRRMSAEKAFSQMFAYVVYHELAHAYRAI